jgi:predicted ABC-type ATPase
MVELTSQENRRTADSWTIFDNSEDNPKIIAFAESGKTEILDSDLFSNLLRYKEEQ